MSNVVDIIDRSVVPVGTPDDELKARKRELLNAIDILRQRVEQDTVRSLLWIYLDREAQHSYTRIARLGHVGNVELLGLATLLVQVVDEERRT